MKTVSVSVDDATWSAAEQAAAAQHTTLDTLVTDFVQDVAMRIENEDEARDARERAALAEALKACKATVGERPTRDRTYSDRRFHRH